MSAPTGYVYALINPSIPNSIKVGATTKNPLNRARELSAPTGLPTPFVLAYSRHVAYPFQVEAAIHRILNTYRTNDSREFFRVELHKVVELIESYDEVRSLFYGADYVQTPFAEMFKDFPDDGSPRALTEDEQFKCRQLEYKLGHGR